MTFHPEIPNMLQLETQLLESELQPIKTAVMAIGGAEDRVGTRQILHTFFKRAGSTSARIVIIPAASRDPQAIGLIYRSIFEDMGAKVEVLDVQDWHQGEDRLLQKYLDLKDCTGVFMSGGDQLRLCGFLAGTPFLEKLRFQIQQGEIVLAGTSAGAAAIGHCMIAGGSSGRSPGHSLAEMAIGLGIIPEVIVDQHFHNRNRMARLLSAIAACPEKLGIGIDEDTCALFEGDGLIQVLGKGTVTIVDPAQSNYTGQSELGASGPLNICNLRLHILSHGACYNLHKREVQS